MKIIITGSTGFIGQNLALYFERMGYEVVRMTFQKNKLSKNSQLEFYDFTAITEHARIFENVAGVVYLANLAHIPERSLSRDYAREVNVTQTLKFASISKKYGVEKFVYLSSVKAVGEKHLTSGYSNTREPNPPTFYGSLKLETEIGLKKIFKDDGKYLAIRAPLVYGAGVKANFLKLLIWINLGLPLPLSGLEVRRSMLFVGNLCHAINHFFCADKIENGAYFLSDGKPEGLIATCEFLAHLLGKPLRLYRIPKKIMSIIPGLKVLTKSLVIDDSEFRSSFKWSPAYSHEHGLAETVKWFKSR